MIPRASIALALAALAGAIQPAARDPLPGQEMRELEWGDLNFLHTTDNHGWHGGHLQEPQYSADLGDYVSFTTHMRQRANDRGVDLLVVDSGDRAEGNGLWDASDPKGLYTRQLLQQVPFDVLTSGNHELYSPATAAHEHLEMVPNFNGRYLSSNIEINATGSWEPFAPRFTKFTTPNLHLNITAFGFLFNFTSNGANTRVTPVNEAVEQQWFVDAVTDAAVDVFVVLAHIDTDFSELQIIHDAIRAAHPKTPIAMLAGHAHQRKFKMFDAASAALESGRYCETAGWLSLRGLPAAGTPGTAPPTVSRRYIDFNRPGFQHHSHTTPSTFDTPLGLSLTASITQHRDALNLSTLLGCSPTHFTPDAAPYGDPQNWYTFLTTHILPTMVRHPHRTEIPRLVFINAGSQRFDVFPGAFTRDTEYIVSPFTSRFMYAREVPWHVARRLHEYFLADPSPFSVDALPPSPPDAADEGEGDEAWGELRRRSAHTLIPGYTTHDDAGTSGDDTVHAAIPRYEIPKVLVANASFHADWEQRPPGSVDVVFLDFFRKNVAAALEALGGGGYVAAEAEAGFEYYDPDEGRTFTRLIVEYVEKEWSGEC
ncbi:Metallo-dependent phosphatase-like protein [Geopyxis carbonaria]|nr:Metallo-dependent phosphatase-like protein [Geopyxis carbonaria]